MTDVIKKQIEKIQQKIHSLQLQAQKQALTQRINIQRTPKTLRKSPNNKQNNMICIQINNKKQKQEASVDSYATLDYLNARYHGKFSVNPKKGNIITKQGCGILLDDQMNFIFSDWKNDHPNGKTVHINRFGNYIYSKWKHQLNSPAGQVIMKIGDYLIMTTFSVLIGKWCMTQKQRGRVFIVIDQKKYAVLVLQGQIIQDQNQLICSKERPLSVVQFTLFPQIQQKSSISRQKTPINAGQPKRHIQEIIAYYAEKYKIKLQKYQQSISSYLKHINEQLFNKYLASQNFRAKLSKRMTQTLYQNQRKQRPANYKQQQQKLYKANCITYQQTNKAKNKKQKFSYFGFLNGLGIKFYNYRLQSHGLEQQSSQKQKVFILKSMGNHNPEYKIQDIGIKIFDNKCLEEGNFKNKQTLTYQNQLFRPTNKLSAIYKKYHKKELNFQDTYFDKNQCSPYKILTLFQKFIQEHVVYIMNQCFNQTTKFTSRKQNHDLSTKALTKSKQILQVSKFSQSSVSRIKKTQNTHTPSSIKKKFLQYSNVTEPVQSSKSANKSQMKRTSPKSNSKPNYQVVILKKPFPKTPLKNQNKQTLTELKNKKDQLNSILKKVKYQIQYQAIDQGQDTLILTDGKQISKIKKQFNKSTDKNKLTPTKNASHSKSFHNISNNGQLKNRRKSYIQMQSNKDRTKQKLPFIQDSLQKLYAKKVKQNYFRTSPKKNQFKSSPKKYRKSEQQLLLEKINDSVTFKQKFNYGIQYHISNRHIESNNSPNKFLINKYNGRERMYTEKQIDQAIRSHYNFEDDFSPRSITPGRKCKTKDQFKHYIYSNTKKNYKNQEMRLQAQKQTQEAIRAQILGITLQEYKLRVQVRKQKQKFLQQSLFQIVQNQGSFLDNAPIIERDPRYIHLNQTFGAYERQNTMKQSSIRKAENSHGTSFSLQRKYDLQSINKQNDKIFEEENQEEQDRNQIQNKKSVEQKSGKQQTLMKGIDYFKSNSVQKDDQKIILHPRSRQYPKKKQQSLVQKRMRILQQFKQMNEKNQQKQYRNIKAQYNQDIYNRLSSNSLKRPLKALSSLTENVRYQKLPVYRQKQPNIDTLIIPLRTRIPQIARNAEEANYYLNREQIIKNRISENRYNRQSVSQFNRSKQLMQKKYSLNQQDRIFGQKIYREPKSQRKYQYYFDK